MSRHPTLRAPLLPLLVLLLYPFPAGAEESALRLQIGDPALEEQTVSLPLDAAVESRTGDLLSFDEVAARLEGTRIVLAGEKHDSMEAHRVQLGLLTALGDRGRPVAIGLEMFPYTEQTTLDDWVAGRISEEELLDAWYEHWGLPWGYYRELFLLARRQGWPMIGLNVPREVVRAVRREGLEEVPEELAPHVPPSVDLDSQDHRTLIRALFAEESGMHGEMTEEQFEAMFAAQATWDAAMAHQAVRALESLEDPEALLVVLVGSGHVAYGLGIERQAAAWSEAPVTGLIPIPVRDEDGGATGPVQASYADLLWGLPREREPFYPSLGASTMDTDRQGPDDRRRVIFVDEDSPAAAAGLRVGDLLLSVDGHTVPDRKALNRRMDAVMWGEEMVLRIQRKGREREVAVRFRRLEEEADEEDCEKETGGDR